MIRFLHISDLHLTRESYESDWEAGGILTKLIQFVNDQPPFDFIFVTGDLARTGGDPNKRQFKTSEYGACKAFLENLVNTARLTDKQRVWIVPGNHDVYAQHGLSLQRLETENDINDLFTSPERRTPYLSKFDPFRHFMKKFQPKCHLAEYDVVRRPEIIDIRGAKLGIIPLNSSWFSKPDGSDHGKLAVGHRLFLDRVQQLKKENPDLIIALIHHPNSYLIDKERSFRDDLVKHCDIVLRGHLHSVETITTSIGGNQVVDLTAGTIYDYQEPKGPKRIFIGELDAVIKKLSIRAYMPSQEGTTWVEDNDAFAGKSCREFIIGDTIITQDCSENTCYQIPYKDPTSIRTSHTWRRDISNWFIGNKNHKKTGAYYVCPQEAMEQLINHFVDILKYMENSPPQASHGNEIQHLATGILLRIAGEENLIANSTDEQKFKELAKSIDTVKLDGAIKKNFANRANEGWIDQHRVILYLFTKGLHNQLSHFFQVPSVNTRDLLSTNGYAQLLLATRLHGEGRFEESNELISSSPAKTCCIGGYVRGQNWRQIGEIDFAMSAYKPLLDELLKEDQIRSCPVTSNGYCMCNKKLFECELKRAIGVVYRKKKNFEMADFYFQQAINAIDQISAPKTMPWKRVAADFYFGYGYFLYEFSKDSPEKMEEAALQFQRAINFLNDSDTIWDSPSTRLGIIKLIQGKIEEAKTFLSDAYKLCVDSDISSNRSVPLSKALCLLGLSVIDIEKCDQTNQESMRELRQAIDISPPLGRGPIECHIHDAENILLACKKDKSKTLVKSFIERLKSELNN